MLRRESLCIWGWRVGFPHDSIFEIRSYCMHGFGVLWFGFDTIPSICRRRIVGVCICLQGGRVTKQLRHNNMKDMNELSPRRGRGQGRKLQ